MNDQIQKILFVGQQPSRYSQLADYLQRMANCIRTVDGRVIQFEDISFNGVENVEKFSIDQLIWRKAQIIVFVYSACNQGSLEAISKGFYGDYMSKKSRIRSAICFLLTTYSPADMQQRMANAQIWSDVEKNAREFADRVTINRLEYTMGSEESMEMVWQQLAH